MFFLKLYENSVLDLEEILSSLEEKAVTLREEYAAALEALEQKKMIDQRRARVLAKRNHLRKVNLPNIVEEATRAVATTWESLELTLKQSQEVQSTVKTQ